MAEKVVGWWVDSIEPRGITWLAERGVVVACCLRHRVLFTAHAGLEPGCLYCSRPGLAEAVGAPARA
jgi:hypothetical protein